MDHDDTANRAADPPRRRRAMPERDGPDRAPKGRARGGYEPSDQDDSDAKEVPEVVADAVRLGYQVIQENLRHGRIAADRFAAKDYGLRDAGDDVKVLGRRVVDLARDLGTSWFDLIAAVLDDERLRNAVRPSDPAKPGSPPHDGSMKVRVVGHLQATGEAFIEPLTGLTGPPQVTALRHLANPADTTAIIGVRLGADPDTGAPCLLAPVPPDQSPGTYSGTVHDVANGRLLGSISVTIPAP